MFNAQKEQALVDARRDAISIAKTTIHPAYTTMVDRLRLAGHNNNNIQSVMMYLVALELAGVVSSVTNDKNMALQIFDIAVVGARDALVQLYEETPPT